MKKPTQDRDGNNGTLTTDSPPISPHLSGIELIHAVIAIHEMVDDKLTANRAIVLMKPQDMLVDLLFGILLSYHELSRHLTPMGLRWGFRGRPHSFLAP